MMRYLVQSRDRIFIKGCGLLSFAKNMGKNIDKDISKYVHTAKNFLIMLRNLPQMHLKLLRNKSTAKNNRICNLIGNKSYWELHHRIVPRKLENIGLDRKIFISKKEKIIHDLKWM